METIVTDRYTELYTNRGGYWLTESAPRMRHTFTRRRILLPGETAADYREVSDAERAQLEAAAESWERPPQAFIDLWRTRGGVFNEDTGYFELNGLRDITYAQAQVIEGASPWHTPQYCGSTSAHVSYSGIYWGENRARTFFMPLIGKPWNQVQANAQNMYYYCSGMEVAPAFEAQGGGYHQLGLIDNMFYGCSRLREVPGLIRCHAVMAGFATTTFAGCRSLEEIRIQRCPRAATANFGDSPLLSAASVRYLVENAYVAGGVAPTVILHPTAMERLTDDILELAATRGITITTT